MTLLVLRPNATVTNSGGVLTGAATVHAALSDDSDASYVSYTGGGTKYSIVELTDLTLPAGAIVKTVTVRARLASSGGATTGVVAINRPGAHGTTVTVLAAYPAIYQGDAIVGVTDAELDAAKMSIAHSGTTTLIAYELYTDVRIVTQPVVTVTAPTATLTTTNMPTVSWTAALDTDGGAQQIWAVRIFTAAQYGIGGFNPDTSPSTLDSYAAGTLGTYDSTTQSWQVSAPLANATYRAYVWVAQIVNGNPHWSSPTSAFSGFTINVTSPSAPSMTLTAQGGAGRVKIDLDDVGGLSTDRFEVQRSADGGTTWAQVRIPEAYYLDGAPGIIVPVSTAAFTIYDYESGNGTAMQYRARALHNYSGLFAASSWTTASVTWSSPDWWLKHPNRPALNVKITRLRSYRVVQRASRQGIFQALGASLPVVVSDTRAGATGSITVLVASLTELQDLDVLLDAGGALLLQGPAIQQEPDRYIAVGSQAASRLVDSGAVALGLKRDVELAWVETASPAGPLTGAEWTP